MITSKGLAATCHTHRVYYLSTYRIHLTADGKYIWRRDTSIPRKKVLYADGGYYELGEFTPIIGSTVDYKTGAIERLNPRMRHHTPRKTKEEALSEIEFAGEKGLPFSYSRDSPTTPGKIRRVLPAVTEITEKGEHVLRTQVQNRQVSEDVIESLTSHEIAAIKKEAKERREEARLQRNKKARERRAKKKQENLEKSLKDKESESKVTDASS